MNSKGFWDHFDNDFVVTMLLVIPVALFLLSGYFKEDIVSITMPVFLYCYSIIFGLLSVHAVNRRIFQFFVRGPVFRGKSPISYWILVSIQFFLAALFFIVASIYIIDTFSK